MNCHPTNEEREALIAGDRADPLEPDEAAELAFLADLLADHVDVGRTGCRRSRTRSCRRSPAPRRVPTTHRRPRVGARSPPRGCSPPAAAHRSAVAAAAIAAVIGVLSSRSGTSADFTARLSATAAAPAARASADITRNDAGFRVALDARASRRCRPVSTTRRG